MATSFRQDTRIGELETPLGKDKLVLVRLDAAEGLSELFEYRVEALSDAADLDLSSAMGKHCTVSFKPIKGDKRYFDGILVESQWLGPREGGELYRLILRPWLWVLSQTSNCLIFHEKTAPQIIGDIFGKHGGLADFEQVLTKTYPKLEYCVQYRESDMDFVCRLMEDNGISYHFRHSDGAHKLIMGDSSSAYEPLADRAGSLLSDRAQQHLRKEEHFHEWHPQRRFTSGKKSLNSYDFKKPSKSLDHRQERRHRFRAWRPRGLRLYGHPSGSLARQRRRPLRAGRHRQDQGDGRAFLRRRRLRELLSWRAGRSRQPSKLESRTTNIWRSAAGTLPAEGYTSGAGSQAGETYEGTYEFMRADRKFAPPAVTPKPYIRGPQTAKVVGKGEIDVDKHGRILVRFHWDRKNDNSMRCRLAQVWAGKCWGGIFIPRMDMEVIVEFLEGDPDRPLVVGTVYNGENKPPYTLPDEKQYRRLEIQFDARRRRLQRTRLRRHPGQGADPRPWPVRHGHDGRARRTADGRKQPLTDIGNDHRCTVGKPQRNRLHRQNEAPQSV